MVDFEVNQGYSAIDNRNRRWYNELWRIEREVLYARTLRAS